jgi:hypothetical protein
MLAATHKPGHRLQDLSPFEAHEGSPQPWTQPAGSAYGCVEWFQYLDRPAAGAAPAPRGSRRPRPDTPL